MRDLGQISFQNTLQVHKKKKKWPESTKKQILYL